MGGWYRVGALTAFAQGLSNNFNHPVGILQHLVVPEAEDAKPVFFKSPCAFFIRIGLLRVLPAIDLDDKFFRQADEIDHVAAHWVLTPEPIAAQLLIAQL